MKETTENEQQYTSRGLPIISKDVLRSLIANHVQNDSWGDHLVEVRERLVEENPILADFIESQLRSYPDHLTTPIAAVVMGTLAILEQQTTANNLAKRFAVADESVQNEEGILRRLFGRNK